MNITDVRMLPDDARFRDLVFVEVETDAGVYGWGEAGGMGRERACEATVQEMKPYFIGQDPGQIELLWNTVYRDAYRRTDDTLLNAMAGIDIDEQVLTRKPFEWKKPLGLGRLWKSNPLMKRPDICHLPGRDNL